MKKKVLKKILVFIIPIFLILLTMYLKLGTIDGNYILISDMEAQYNSLLQYFKNILNGTESLFYSFHKGLGGEMFTTFTYYLASPLNFLVIFFDNTHIPDCAFLIILIKIGLSGLTMNFFLDYKYNKNYNLNFVISLCYALMSYTVNYYFNIMWLDSVYMLPLVTMGLDMLINHNKNTLYLIALSYMIICNYYMAYMVCIFCVMYLIYQFIINRNFDKKIIVKFILFSILAALIASFILIPTIIKIKSFASTQGNLNITYNYLYNTFKDMIQNMIIGGHNCSNVTNEYGIYMFTSNICVILLLIYFFNQKVEKRNKIALFIILLIFMLSFYLLPLKYIWHGFSLPSFYNNRNSFIFNFIILIICIPSYYKCDRIEKRYCFIISIFYLALTILNIIILGKTMLMNLFITYIFVIIYMILLFTIKNYRIYKFQYILWIFIILELFINLYLSFVTKTVVSYTYSDYINNICPIMISSSLDYRSENLMHKNGIDGLTCGYNSTTTFLSTLTNDDLKNLNKFGYYAGGKVQYNLGANTLLIDSILGTKYYLLSEGSKINYLKNTNNCQNVGIYNKNSNDINNEEYCLYENSNSLGISYIVKNIDFDDTNNVFENQTELIKNMTGINKEYLYKLDYIYRENKFYINNNKERFYIYIYADINVDDKIAIYADGKQIYTSEDSSSLTLNNGVLEVYSNNDITTLKIKVNDNSDTISKIMVYGIDNKVENEAYNILKNNTVNITNISTDYMLETVDAKEEGYLLFTIPYDKNIDIYIDGEKNKSLKAYNYFLSTKISEGKHIVKIKYNHRSYYKYSCISLLFIIISIICVKKCKNI